MNDLESSFHSCDTSDSSSADVDVESDEHRDCVICLDPLDVDETTALPCAHTFHTDVRFSFFFL